MPGQLFDLRQPAVQVRHLRRQHCQPGIQQFKRERWIYRWLLLERQELDPVQHLCLGQVHPVPIIAMIELQSLSLVLRRNKNYPYRYSSIAAYIATIFFGGTSGRMLWIGLNTKPPPGESVSILRCTSSLTWSGVPRFRIWRVSTPPPQKVSSLPNSRFRRSGCMSRLLVCTGLMIS